MYVLVFFFNDTATTEIYTLSLHDALPIYVCTDIVERGFQFVALIVSGVIGNQWPTDDDFDLGIMASDELHHFADRSEEHTSELQSRQYLVCRLLLEKKKSVA